MLPSTPHIEAVYLGKAANPLPENTADDHLSSTTAAAGAAAAVEREGYGAETAKEAEGRGLLDWVRPGTLLVDSSTIDPLASRRVNAVATRKVRRNMR